MIGLIALLVTQSQVSPELQAKLDHVQELKPVVQGVVDAIVAQDDVALGNFVTPGTMLTDADGNKFPFVTATFTYFAKNCTFQTMSFDTHPLFDDGTIWWNCPEGSQRLYLRIRDSKVFSASPFRNPNVELPEALRTKAKSN